MVSQPSSYQIQGAKNAASLMAPHYNQANQLRANNMFGNMMTMQANQSNAPAISGQANAYANLMGNYWNALVADKGNWYDYDAAKYGYNTQGNIAQLQDKGQTERLGMQTASNEAIQALKNELGRYQADQTLAGQLGVSKNQLKGTKYQADSNYNIADISTARSLEGLKYGADQQTEQARIGITPQMEKIALERDMFDRRFPIYERIANAGIDFLGQNSGGYGGGSGAEGQNRYSLPAHLERALTNRGIAAAHQFLGQHNLDAQRGVGGRGGTAYNSGSVGRADTLGRIAAADMASKAALDANQQIASTYLPYDMQLRSLAEASRHNRAQEGLGYLNSTTGMLAALGGLV